MDKNKPKELKPTSHSKEEQIIIKEDDIFGDEKKEQFRVFGLIHQTRHLIQGEIVKRMYPSEVLMISTLKKLMKKASSVIGYKMLYYLGR